MSTFNQNFNGFAKRIFSALGFTDEVIASKFQSFLDEFSKEDKFKLINDTERYVASLEAVDNELKELKIGSLAQYMDQIKDNWDTMNEQLAQLQILSLIQRKEDCSGVIKELLGILSRKIETVNGILKQNLGMATSAGANTSASAGPSASANTSAGPSASANAGPSSSTNPGAGAGASALKKYLKYKNKYLALKNLI